MLTDRPDQRGFTLIEVMIALGILAILITQALPNLSAWIKNMQIRNNTESILNGLQIARAQALRSNTNTEFVLIATGTAPVVANVGAAAAANGTNWIVRNYQAGGAYVAADFVQGRSGREGSKDTAEIAQVVAGAGSGVTAGGPWVAGSYVFTPLGRLLNPPLGVTAINIDVTSSAAPPFVGIRPMRIIVSTGGQTLMCDPGRVDPTNPQFCPL